MAKTQIWVAPIGAIRNGPLIWKPTNKLRRSDYEIASTSAEKSNPRHGDLAIFAYLPTSSYTGR